MLKSFSEHLELKQQLTALIPQMETARQQAVGRAKKNLIIFIALIVVGLILFIISRTAPDGGAVAALLAAALFIGASFVSLYEYFRAKKTEDISAKRLMVSNILKTTFPGISMIQMPNTLATAYREKPATIDTNFRYFYSPNRVKTGFPGLKFFPLEFSSIRIAVSPQEADRQNFILSGFYAKIELPDSFPHPQNKQQEYFILSPKNEIPTHGTFVKTNWADNPDFYNNFATFARQAEDAPKWFDSKMRDLLLQLNNNYPQGVELVYSKRKMYLTLTTPLSHLDFDNSRPLSQDTAMRYWENYYNCIRSLEALLQLLSTSI